MADVIERDLQPFPEIHGSALEAVFDDETGELNLALIEIRDGHPYALIAPAINGRTRVFTEFLASLARRYRLPDVRLLYNPLDEARVLPGAAETWVPPTSESYLSRIRALATRPDAQGHPSLFSPWHWPVTGRRVPILSTAKVRAVHLDVLVPGEHVLTGHVSAGINDVAWHDRAPILYWRGSTTGGRVRAQTWRRFPRIRLACAAQDRRGVDIGLTDINQCEDAETSAQIRAHVGVRPREPFSRCFQHKYLYDIEGNSYSSRLAPFLVSGSVIFKHRPVYDEFFFPWLEAGVHYVPMSDEFDDLEEQVEWARRMDHRLPRIADNARRLAANCLTREFAERYMMNLLTQYAARYRDD